jgi:hypothetical protein
MTTPTIRKVRCKKQTDNTVKQCVKDLLEDNPFATWAMIAEALSQRCQLKASRSTAGRLLKKAGYTRKTACRVVNKVHEPTAVMTFCKNKNTKTKMDLQIGQLIVKSSSGWVILEVCL